MAMNIFDSSGCWSIQAALDVVRFWAVFRTVVAVS
jgi:hypothetical protein